MIYFIRSGDAVKIGYAAGPVTRIPTLQTANPNSLVVLGIMEGNMQTERELHARFHRRHIRGEWFELCVPILAFIQENCRPYFPNIRRIGIMPPKRASFMDWFLSPAGCLTLAPFGFILVGISTIGLLKLDMPFWYHLASAVYTLAFLAIMVVGVPLACVGTGIFNVVRGWRYHREVRRRAV